ncbi:Phosphate transport system permease protein PstA [Sodalis glossinidius str. 'morsitans']|nr:Phosphate transport system permease protein PstA [Sodalis glossinidius str. 'morsitans']
MRWWGIALGFSLIPLLFTLAEEALFGVPTRLIQGSLALGATPWQTLMGVPLPAASAGLVSAFMLTLGRAMGETMIVLIASGNLPRVDGSVLQGLRALAANIAIEIPEALRSSEHYRVLFLSALLLLVFTFIINSIAELLRLRLQHRYCQPDGGPYESIVVLGSAVGMVDRRRGEPESTGAAGESIAATALAAADLPLYTLRLSGVLLGVRAEVQRPHAPAACEIWFINTGNRPQDRYWVPAAEVRSSRLPADVLVVQRRSGAQLYGYLAGMHEDGQPLTAALDQRLRLTATQCRLAAQVEQQRNAVRVKRAQQLQQEQQRMLHHQGALTEQQQAAQRAAFNELQTAYDDLSEQLAGIERERGRVQLILADAQGQRQIIALSDIDSLWYLNAMNLGQKLRHLTAQTWRFVSFDDPAREGNGVFPAIVGMLLLVMLMSVLVMPFGVMAAIYLHEYAGRNGLTRLICIAVGNLAGVPSIVYGIFGLGFFVYAVGGSLDKLFYAEALPAPTFGTPGLLCAALTLALGATQLETLWRVVLPGAAPAIMTGLILAVVRAAGEAAPLMLVGSSNRRRSCRSTASFLVFTPKGNLCISVIRSTI